MTPPTGKSCGWACSKSLERVTWIGLKMRHNCSVQLRDATFLMMKDLHASASVVVGHPRRPPEQSSALATRGPGRVLRPPTPSTLKRPFRRGRGRGSSPALPRWTEQLCTASIPIVHSAFSVEREHVVSLDPAEIPPLSHLLPDGDFAGRSGWWFCSGECYRKAMARYLDPRFDFDTNVQDDEEYKRIDAHWTHDYYGDLMTRFFS